VLFMSSAFFPLQLQPAWLQRVADANPPPTWSPPASNCSTPATTPPGRSHH